MAGRSEVELSPIGAADLDEVGRFLHEHLNSRLTAERWAAAIAAPWGHAGPNHGFQLRLEGAVVGVNLAFYAERAVGGSLERFCNVAALCVLPEYRSHVLRLLRAVLRQPGYHFTDLSPSGNVVELDRRLGFRPLDSTTLVRVNVGVGRRSGVRVVTGATEIENLLTGADLRLYRDHRGSLAARHLVLVRGDEHCYVVLRRDRRKRLPIFASVLYVGNPELFLAGQARLARHLFFSQHALVTLTELRLLRGVRPSQPFLAVPGRPKMLKSTSLSPEDVDGLYSELSCVPW